MKTRLAACMLAAMPVLLCAQATPSNQNIIEGSGSVTAHPLGAEMPKHYSDGADLPNGWRITPAGRPFATIGDLVTNLTVSPDGRVLIALNSGFTEHALTVFDAHTQKQLQRIPLASAWLGLAWSGDGHTLYVSGGNGSGARAKKARIEALVTDAHETRKAAAEENLSAPIYAFAYRDGKLSEQPTTQLRETANVDQVWWSGVAVLPAKHVLYAANRGDGTSLPGSIAVFDTESHQLLTHIAVGISPYATVLSRDGRRLYVSNWSSESISIIDTATNSVVRTVQVGKNPNDMKLTADGRLFVACSNDNTVYVIDTKTEQVAEKLSTTLTPNAPEGSTPDALAIDDLHKLLYIANADNNSIAVAHIENREHGTVVGFVPTGWYPSALALADKNTTLFIGNAKGEEGHPDPLGPHSPLTAQDAEFSQGKAASGTQTVSGGIFSLGTGSVHTLQTSSLEVLPVSDLRTKLPAWTKRVTENTPYRDSLLAEARQPKEPSVVPVSVGTGSPIKHIIYILKENRTYDQVFGDVAKANGDARLAIFGQKVTPNQHALAEQYEVLDNLYCDGEVSMDGHYWSMGAYATDFDEKQWPAGYGGIAKNPAGTQAIIPNSGFLWDDARRAGLTYRIYEEFMTSVKVGDKWEAHPVDHMDSIWGHFNKDYAGDIAVRDTAKEKIFEADLADWEKNFDSADQTLRMPSLVVMRMPEDHTYGARVGQFTPASMVADNDAAIGKLVEAVSHSKYWPTTAIFLIEDDAQDGSDHVDARRTMGMVISPYVKRGIVDSTLYTTSSFLRTMELLLGLPPMSQYDAAAMPLYNSFGTEMKPTEFTALAPQIDDTVRNTKQSPGAKASAKMDFSGPDRAPMHALNKIIWQSVMGPDAVMPPPVHRFRPIVDPSEAPGAKDGDD